MLKWLLFALCLFVVYYLFFKKPKYTNQQENTSDSIMFECKECGTYISSDEAIIKDGKYYCSKECAKLK